MTLRAGLTGGVASGKSTVSAMLAEMGAVIIDADSLAREVVAVGTPGLAAVVAAFGSSLLTRDGELDRAAMGKLVFADAEARRRLESIVHPLVHERMSALEAAAAEDSLVVHDIPLLAESGRAATFDAVIVVDCPVDLQIARLLSEREWGQDDAEARIAAQASRDDRLAIATHVINNVGSLEELRDRVAAVFHDLREGA